MKPLTLAEHRQAKKLARRLKTIDLDALEVATPCSASWEEMDGDARSRFCGACEKNVYDFSQLTRDEIAELLTRRGERVCGRLYRRADGTVLTADCPVGLAARLKRRLLRVGGLLGAVVTFLLGWWLLRPVVDPVMGEMCADPDRMRLEYERAQQQERAQQEERARQEEGARQVGEAVGEVGAEVRGGAR